jgi:hypothetical protein
VPHDVGDAGEPAGDPWHEVWQLRFQPTSSWTTKTAVQAPGWSSTTVMSLRRTLRPTWFHRTPIHPVLVPLTVMLPATSLFLVDHGVWLSPPP